MKMTAGTTFVFCILLLSAGPSFADDNDLPVPADEFVFCTVCHGVQLMGNSIMAAPRLSGMESWYVERQLQAFRTGWRGTHSTDLSGNEMQPMAESLSESQVATVAEFVNKTRSAPPPTTITGDAANGEVLYRSCSACHGANADGNEVLGAPALTGLNDWYLVTQLENFRNGTRGGDSADTWGAQMAAAAVLLEDDQAVKDVVTFITGLTSN